MDPKTESNVGDLPVGIWNVGIEDDKPFVIVNTLVLDSESDDKVIEFYQEKIDALKEVIAYFQDQIYHAMESDITHMIKTVSEKARLPVILSEIWDEDGKDCNGLYRVGLDWTPAQLEDYARNHGVTWK